MSEEMNGKASYSREEIRGKIKSNEKNFKITLYTSSKSSCILKYQYLNFIPNERRLNMMF